MGPQRYLPSTQFSLIVFSIAISLGCIYAAERVSAPPQPSAVVASNTPLTANQGNWEATLYAIQAEEGSSSLPTPPDKNTVAALTAGAQSPNLTETLGKTLLVNLANVQAQGLGADIPTQNDVITSALSQVAPSASAKAYTTGDLTIVADSPASHRAYGNATIAVLQKHPNASMAKTFEIVGAAVNGDPSGLPQLAAIGADYQALAKDLAAIPVPQIFAPSHLALINAFVQMAATYSDMATLETDPLRGLQGLQTYKAADNTIQTMFINIGQILSKDDILWGKDEPGALWSVLLSAQ